MRKLTFCMQTTLNNRIANPAGELWNPFAWGEVEQAFVNPFYAAADTWIMSRPVFESVVPWWEEVARGEWPDDAPALSDADREFAATFGNLTKIAISHTPQDGYETLAGDLAGQLAGRKRAEGREIILSTGPATLAPLLATHGLIDELYLMIHPTLLSAGPRLFDEADAALQLISTHGFDAGAIAARYKVRG